MSDIAPAASALPLRLHRDHLYIEAVVFEAHMPQVRSVALVREADDLLILPIVTAEAGGFLVKQVNARGDRAIHAADFFRLNDIGRDTEHRCRSMAPQIDCRLYHPKSFRKNAN
jgi:hypothetical protein